jgi:type II secretory pathway pseudopilin PulG
LTTVTNNHESPVLGSTAEAKERGFAMIGTLAVVLILGVLATIVLSSNHPATPSGSGASPLVTTTTVPQSVGSGAQEAAISACKLNFQALTTALADYRALNGAYPAAGTTWATSSTNGGPYLAAWPTDAHYYSIAWNGLILSVIPVRGVASQGSIGTSSPVTGCFAA